MTDDAAAAERRSRDQIRKWGEPVAIGALALAVRLAGIDHTPYVDELNHVMAAQSLLSDGSLRLADGVEYTRAQGLTYLIAALFAAFGETLVVARIPALVAGVALVVALFVWLRAAGGSVAAWIGGVLLVLSPGAIYFSQQARFYSIQPLFFFLAAILIHRAVSLPEWRRRPLVLLLGAAAICLAIALHFQPTTLIGAGALAAWAVAFLVFRLWASGERRAAVSVGVGASGVAGVALAIVLLSPRLMRRLVHLATFADEWAAEGAGELLFYVWHFERQYVVLFALLPLFALLAVLRNARAGIFGLWMFAVPLGVHSLLAWKHERYIAYTLPFLFVIVGLGAAHAAQLILPLVRDWLTSVTRGVLSRRVGTLVAGALLILAGLFALRPNMATVYALQLLTTTDAEWEHEIAYRGEADWPAAAPILADAVERSDVVVSSIELKAMHYFGRQDVLLSRDYLPQNQEQPEFGTFSKMRRPVISTPESLELLMQCVPSGLVLVEERQWRRPWGVLDATADVLEERMEPIALPPHTRMRAFTWEGNGHPEAAPECQVVAERVRLEVAHGG